MSTTSTALDFDFNFALATLDPHHVYSATKLSGGIINLTARITISKKEPESNLEEHECLFDGVSSVVAKYAPPYVAALGEDAPFSQYRQTIEARALELFSDPNNRAYMHTLHHRVTTPTLIHHNPSAHVLIMQDLGDALTLDQWFHTCPSADLAQAAGERFGMFLARLGGLEDVNEDGMEERFKNPDKEVFLLRTIVRAVQGNMMRCGVDKKEAEELTEACMRVYTQAEEGARQGGGRKVFGLGDCWPRSLLVGATNTIPNEYESQDRASSPTLAVVDWEFAGMIQPFADIAQLSAHLYIQHQTSPSHFQPLIQAFTLALLRTHHAHTPERCYAHQHYANAWRVFGTDVVNNAFESDWFGGDVGRKEIEGRELGRRGVAFMRIANEMERQGGEGGGVLFEGLFNDL
ncbi:hypothetical protein BDV93DRAFT_602171 [Ceratobasidium sp. AG-I]|nr:hypothetical protein BDV93DRAFT_602171 [Ceratobasidium sp. AG-I]